MRRHAASRWCGGVAWVALVLAGCQVTIPEPSATFMATASVVPRVTPGRAPSATPRTPTGTSSAPQLPNPGGTCRLNQFVTGPATSQYDFSTAGSRVAEAFQPLANTGDDCVLAVPKTIAMAGATGPFVAISLRDAGQQVCVDNACKEVYPGSYKVPSGQSVRIELRAYWPSDPTSSSPPPPACADPITNVTRAEFPFASGSIEISWDIPFREVCSSAGSVAITVGRS
jgi:hypothetical protein